MSRRDETGLTAKQRESLPHIITAETIRAGVLKIVELKIINDANYWYMSWWRDDAYVRAITEGREALLGKIRESTLQKLMAFHHDAVNTVLVGMLKKGPQQLGFCRLYYDMLSTLSGIQMVPIPKTSINIGVVSRYGEGTSHSAFPLALAAHHEQRQEMLRILRSKPVAIIEPSNGDGDGNGNGSDR